ncbi:MAG: hypothetical protein AAF480_01700 [Actinomycetota bacterium]
MADTTATSEVLRRVLADRPDVHRHLGDAWAAAPVAVEPRLLAICAARMATLLGGPDDDAFPLDGDIKERLADWPTSDVFDETDRACLAFTEQFVIDVASLDDATADAVVTRLGSEGFGNFVNALLVAEQRQRLRLIWDRLEVTP